MLNRATFSGYDADRPLYLELDDDPDMPTTMMTFDLTGFNKRLLLEDNGTHFIYVSEGHGYADRPDDAYANLAPGMFAVIPGMCVLSGIKGLVMTRHGYSGLFQVGGPVEQEGRLKYIDGCTDTLLVSPVRKGDPCLNLLYFPPGIDQTAHTHPSVRGGLVMSGRGEVVYLNASGREVSEDLTPGKVWIIHTGGWHKFRTPYGEPLRVLAYHPDSDFGPDDEQHPMLNRTIVDGRPANAPENAAIRTK